jgi:single-strand selective monofunctional uracil DNA glycosylase
MKDEKSGKKRIVEDPAALIQAAKRLRRDLAPLAFSSPVTHVYNPLEYAWEPYRVYLERFGLGPKRVFFLGMNPGPWGMAQTGIPFGEVTAVREWLRIDAPVDRPEGEHPKRPILGLDCGRSEVSGRRLWGLFSARWGDPDAFFREHFVANYCPLVFMDSGARNVTPDKLPAHEFVPLREVCDRHLKRMLEVLQPTYWVGIGQFAETCLRRIADQTGFPVERVRRILHPSPASPAANRGWGEAVEKVLVERGIWPRK